LKLVDDCERFVLRFFDVIKESAMHIYHSALAWSPMSSLTRQLYQKQMMTEVNLANAIDAQWDDCIRTIPIHDQPYDIVFSHKGSALAVAYHAGVKIFETVTGVATFETDKPAVSVAFSPDDDMLVCGCVDGTLRIWDVQTSDLIQSFEGHEDLTYSVMFSPCGNMIVSGGDENVVRIWDISSGQCKSVLKGHSTSVRAVCWCGTGDRVISGSGDRSVRVWDVSSQMCLMILRAHTRWVISVASSCDSSLFASGSDDRTVQVYDARSGDVLQTISTDYFVAFVQFSTHADKLLYTTGRTATIWDLSRKEKVSTIKCDGSFAAFSPDGTRVVSQYSGFVQIQTTENEYSNSETVIRHSNDILSINFAPDGSVMASWSDSDAKIWDTTSGDCLFTISSRSILQSIVFSPNSAFLAYLSLGIYADRKVHVWNVHTRSPVEVARFDLEVDFNNVALSPCGDRLVSLSSSDMILWDFGTGQRLAHLDVDFPIPWISRITFADDGTSVFTRSVNGDEIMLRWRISPAPSLSGHGDQNSNSDQSTSLPLTFIPIQDKSSHNLKVVSANIPRQCCRYEGSYSEWILDSNEERILWLPPDRRSSTRDCYGKKVAVGTDSGQVYIADFSDAL
jgi:WD40 repeat protein